MGARSPASPPHRSLSAPVPWKEMFGGSFSKSSDDFRGAKQEHRQEDNPNAGKISGRFDPQEALSSELDLVRLRLWDEAEKQQSRKPAAAAPPLLPPAMDDPSKMKAINFQLALDIAMAHAGLMLLVLTLYGLGLLLHDFWKPIQWAVLCSITLREIQRSLVRFWDAPLRAGLLQTLVAVPAAVIQGAAQTIRDALAFAGRRRDAAIKIGFSKLLQWLVAFGFVSLGFHKLGAAPMAGVVVVATAAVAGIRSSAKMGAPDSDPAAPPPCSKRRRARPLARIAGALNRHVTGFIATRLPTIVAIALIAIMIVVSVAGPVFLSYKVGCEAKDAVVALKDHVQRHNYTEIVAVRQWLERSNLTAMVEQHSSAAYETVSRQIDAFGVQYNLTEFTDAGKEFLLNTFARSPVSSSSNSGRSDSSLSSSHPVFVRLERARTLLREYDLKGLYAEMEAVLSLLLDHLQLKPEDVKERVRQVSEAGAGIGKRVFFGGTQLLYGGTSVAVTVASSIASGAAGIFNFLTQALVFFSLLYYLITSESGGVMEQILAMVPLSDATRSRSATVLNHAVSSVLLATVKSAFFQAAFTWLLFRSYGIHFLYVSTLLAIITAVLPILPHFLAAIPAAAQLVVQGDYVGALVLSVVHFLVLDFGNRAIQDEIPGHNAYLTGLSIAGGMALFSPAFEGAIMGPLLMTVLIALKNLYCEFVLNPERALA